MAGCKPCIGEGIKSSLLKEYPGLEELLDKIPTCSEALGIELCPCAEEGGGRRRKRAPSAYNTFIGSCMKQGKGMKDCAAEYKRSK